MEKEDNYTAPMPPNFNEFDYSTAATAHHHHLMSNDNNMVDYMLNNPNHDHPQPLHHHQHFDDNTVTSSNNHTFTAALGNYHLPPGSLDGSAMTLSNRFMAGSFADVMQFADFGPKLALNGPNDDDGEDDSNSNTAAAAVNYFLKFPVLNDHLHHQQQQQHQEDDDHQFPFSTAAETLQQQQEQFMLVLSDDGGGHDPHQQYGSYGTSDQLDQQPHLEAAATVLSDDADGPRSDQAQPVQLNFLTQSSNNNNISMAAVKGAAATTTTSTSANKNGNNNNGSNKRKRPRTVKTTEEVESQRMIHIAVERNRRKQMNEHLRVLRSLMPSSYVQRGDQASIIGGAIEFVRELEQLLQCLESQKRRRLYGDSGTGTTPPVLPINPSPSYNQPTTQSQLNFLDPNNQTNEDDDDEDQSQQQQQLATAALAANNKAMLLNSNDHELDASGAVQLQQPPPVMLLGLREETAENKSCVADVEVKLLGFDALIKILSRRRPGQLISAISALQDLEFSILHTNITTIEQTVLYSFNVKVQSEQRFSADDIATSVQQIFTFIHANSNTSM